MSKEIKVKCSKCDHNMKIVFKKDWKKQYELLKKENDILKQQLAALKLKDASNAGNFNYEDLMKSMGLGG